LQISSFLHQDLLLILLLELFIRGRVHKLQLTDYRKNIVDFFSSFEKYVRLRIDLNELIIYFGRIKLSSQIIPLTILI